MMFNFIIVRHFEVSVINSHRSRSVYHAGPLTRPLALNKSSEYVDEVSVAQGCSWFVLQSLIHINHTQVFLVSHGYRAWQKGLKHWFFQARYDERHHWTLQLDTRSNDLALPSSLPLCKKAKTSVLTFLQMCQSFWMKLSTLSDESIDRDLVCAHMHFIARTQKILTFMSSTVEWLQQKHTQHAPFMETECDYLCGLI